MSSEVVFRCFDESSEVHFSFRSPYLIWFLFRRKISRSFVSIAVRFFSFGVYCGRHAPLSCERGEIEAQETKAFALP